MSEQDPTHNERTLAGALIIILSVKALDSPGGTTVPLDHFLPATKPELLKSLRVGYQMMGVDSSSFAYSGADYDQVLSPAIRVLYDRFGIIEQIMNS